MIRFPDGTIQTSSPTAGSGSSIYSATSTAGFPYGFSATTAVFSSAISVGAFLNVKNFGARGDTRTLTDAAMSSATTRLTSVTAAFTSADVGKTVFVRGAISASTIPLTGTVTGYVSATAVDLSIRASTNVTGARLDIGTLDTAAFNLAVASIPSTGGVVYAPAGIYMLGASTANNYFSIQKSYVTFKGDGMQATKLIYSSQLGLLGNADGSGEGMAVWIAPSFSSGPTNVSLYDFTIEDTNNVFITYPGHAGSGIGTYLVDQLRIQRVEVVNAKGNAAITGVGLLGGGILGDSEIYIQDCILRGDSTGGWIQGDGINMGNYRNVNMLNNTITAPSRHAFEGGGLIDQYIAMGNTIDMSTRGLSGINPTGANKAIVSNNNIFNVSTDYYGVDFTVDEAGGGQFSLEDILISDNYIQGTNQIGIRFQNTSVFDTPEMNRWRVLDNYVESSSYGIIIDTFTNLQISGNIFKFASASGQMLAQPGACGAAWQTTPGRQMVINNNILTGNLNEIIDYDCMFPPWQNSSRIKIYDNTIGNTLVSESSETFVNTLNFERGFSSSTGTFSSTVQATSGFFNGNNGIFVSTFSSTALNGFSIYSSSGAIAANTSVTITIPNTTAIWFPMVSELEGVNTPAVSVRIKSIAASSYVIYNADVVNNKNYVTWTFAK